MNKIYKIRNFQKIFIKYYKNDNLKNFKIINQIKNSFLQRFISNIINLTIS